MRVGVKTRVKGWERNIRRWLGRQSKARKDNERTGRQVEGSRRRNHPSEEEERSVMDVTVDAELDRLISRRASQDRRPDPDETEEPWKESVRAYNARREEEVRSARVEYHRGQAVRLRTVLEALISRHESEAAKLMDIQQEGTS